MALLPKLLLSKGLEVKLISQTPHSRNVCSRLDLIKMQVNSFGHNLVAFEIVLAWMVGGVLISFMFTYGKSSASPPKEKKSSKVCVLCKTTHFCKIFMLIFETQNILKMQDLARGFFLPDLRLLLGKYFAPQLHYFDFHWSQTQIRYRHWLTQSLGFEPSHTEAGKEIKINLFS